MESLSGIGSSLPPSVPDAELAHAFRGAALSLTALFKAGKNSTRKAYLAGKREALQDVLEFIQASLDHPPSATAAGQPTGPLNVARLIDYLCARQETIKAEEEGDDDDVETVRPSRAQAVPLPRSTSFPPRAAPAHPPATAPMAPPRPASHPTTPAAPSHAAASHGAVSTIALANSAGGVSALASVPSPLTRLKARREREHHRDRDHRRGGRASVGAVVAGGGPAVQGESLSAGALKRRWGAVAMTEVELDDDGDESDDSPGREESDEGENGTIGAGEDAMELEGMEMEGWDGLGERPAKRIARRA